MAILDNLWQTGNFKYSDVDAPYKGRLGSSFKEI